MSNECGETDLLKNESTGTALNVSSGKILKTLYKFDRLLIGQSFQKCWTKHNECQMGEFGCRMCQSIECFVHAEDNGTFQSSSNHYRMVFLQRHISGDACNRRELHTRCGLVPHRLCYSRVRLYFCFPSWTRSHSVLHWLGIIRSGTTTSSNGTWLVVFMGVQLLCRNDIFANANGYRSIRFFAIRNRLLLYVRLDVPLFARNERKASVRCCSIGSPWLCF